MSVAHFPRSAARRAVGSVAVLVLTLLAGIAVLSYLGGRKANRREP